MQNKILHALSNRQGPFASEIFSRLTDFVPIHLNAEAVNLRRKLFLDVTDTDYYLKIYLSLLYSFPDISRQLNDRITTYCIEDFNPRGVEISGGELCSAPSLFSMMTRGIANLSRDLLMSLSFLRILFPIGGSILARNGVLLVPSSNSFITASKRSRSARALDVNVMPNSFSITSASGFPIRKAMSVPTLPKTAWRIGTGS